MSVFQYEVKKLTDEKRNKIRWYFSVYYRDWEGNKKQKKKMGYLTKSECIEGQTEFLKTIKKNSEIPFDKLYDRYIKYCVKIKNIKKTTLLTKKNIFEHHILPYFKDTPLNEISKEMICEFFLSLTDKSMSRKGRDLSPSFRRTIKIQLSGILNYGKEFFGLEKNNCWGIDIGGENTIRENVWTVEDFKKFIKYFDNDLMYKTIFTLLWSSGMREGELLGLQLRDFDFNNNCVSINRNYQFDGTEYIYTTPKTKSSIRTVSLPKVTMDLVKQYSMSIYELDSKDRLFDTKKENLLYRIKKGCRETNVMEIPIHCIRHSFITSMINNNVPPKTVSVMVGHKDVKTTLNIYTHCNYENQQTVSNVMEEQLKDVI